MQMNKIKSQSSMFINTYRTFLRDEGVMSIEQISDLYKKTQSSLHKYSNSKQIDIEAFIYAYLRLPTMIHEAKYIVMAQTESIFEKENYKLNFWEEVHAPARRRKIYFDGEKTLAVYINSVTDVDDLVGLLTTYTIEWNKIHDKLRLALVPLSKIEIQKIQSLLQVDDENWNRILRIFDTDPIKRFELIFSKRIDFSLKLLKGHYIDYKKASQRWFENIVNKTRHEEIRNKPIYFISSNTHSIVNNLTGWVTRVEPELIEYLKKHRIDKLLNYWKQIEKGEHPGSRENFLWYVLKKYEVDNPSVRIMREKFEREIGIDFIEAKHYLDINAQVISLSRIIESGICDKLGIDSSKIAASQALIVNIDYPLGAGAYMVLSTLLRNVNDLRGVYILGKASFLHGNLGDIGIPSKVFDTYANNTYYLENAFTKSDFKDFLSGSVLTNQKVVSLKGTLLNSEDTIKEYFMQGYAILEMEDGPYLNALYETTHFDRYPEAETVTLIQNPIDIGIIHYASDTPYTKAITLGTRSLGYEGIEATYISSLAIIKRIMEKEAGE